MGSRQRHEDDGRATTSAFSSLRLPAYRNLWWAGTFAFTSVQMQFLLRGVLAWDLTEREGALGLVFLCFGVTMLIATPLGGVAADRLANRKVLLTAQTVLAAGATGMGVVVVTGVVQFWMLLVASVAQGLAFGFYGPARVAFAAKIVGRDQLGNAITLSMLSLNGTRVFAPAFAGVLAGFAFFGIGGAYLVSAGFSLLALFFLVRCPAGAAPERTSTDGPFREIVNGLRYVGSNPPLRRLIVSSFFVIMFGFNYVAFIPALVEGIFELGDPLLQHGNVSQQRADDDLRLRRQSSNRLFRELNRHSTEFDKVPANGKINPQPVNGYLASIETHRAGWYYAVRPSLSL